MNQTTPYHPSQVAMPSAVGRNRVLRNTCWLIMTAFAGAGGRDA